MKFFFKFPFQLEDGFSIADRDDSLQNKVRALAHIVAGAMGGSIPTTEANSYSNAFHLSELKTQLGCNCIPLGMIKKGHYLHRALLFKLLADLCEDMQCALYRGQADRAWNLVYIGEQQQHYVQKVVDESQMASDNPDDHGTAADSAQKDQQHWFVVDLMHNVGELYQQRSWEARQYCCPERHAPLDWSLQQSVFTTTSTKSSEANEDDKEVSERKLIDGLTPQGREFFANIMKQRMTRKQKRARKSSMRQPPRSILVTSRTDPYSPYTSFSRD